MATRPTPPTMKPLRRIHGHRQYRCRPSLESTEHNNDFNTQVRFYNSKLEDAFGSNLRGTSCKYLRVVDPETGIIVNDRKADTPVSISEINSLSMAEWDVVNGHYHLGWTAATSIVVRRSEYRVFLGLN